MNSLLIVFCEKLHSNSESHGRVLYLCSSKRKRLYRSRLSILRRNQGTEHLINCLTGPENYYMNCIEFFYSDWAISQRNSSLEVYALKTCQFT